ncbi:MAG: hypothetical protein DHS20C20_28610 [Ardenticatenaceae bacterium]|nr:MAG: hypothetical protein DHS20C20_28610 [Ardenticatenaceae bacterium]
MNQTNILDLRPLSIAELFDRSFRLYRKHFGTFLSIMVITQLPIYLFGVATASAENSTTSATLGIVTSILTLIFTQVGAAVLTKSVSDSYLGRKIDFRQSFKRIGGTWFTLIFATILAALVIVGLLLPFFCIFSVIFPPVSSGMSNLVIRSFIYLLIIVIVLAFGNVLFSLIPPVVVLEKKGPVDSLKRAWELAKKRYWWSFGYLSLLILLSIMVISGSTLIILFVLNRVFDNPSILYRTIAVDTASSLFSAIFMPIRLAAITLMYFDLRVRFEGFDLMVLSAADDTLIDDASNLTTKRSL